MKSFLYLLLKLVAISVLMTIIIYTLKSEFNANMNFLKNNFFEISQLYIQDNDFYIQWILLSVLLQHIFIQIKSTSMKNTAQMLPRNFDFYNINEEGKVNLKNISIDEVKNKTFDKLISMKDKLLIYSNATGKISFDNYEKNKENIKQYFGIDADKDIKITRFENNKVKIDLKDRFPRGYEWNNKRHLREQEIFFGTNEDGKDIFIHINKLSHFFLNGASGSGKTIWTYQFLMGVFYNIDYFEKVFLIDLKGGVSMNKFSNIDKVEVIDNLKDMYEAVNKITLINEERLEEIKQRQNKGEFIDKLEDSPILFLIDEFAEVKNGCPQKEEKEQFAKHKIMLQQLESLAARARSQNIKLFVITQKGTIKESGVEFKGNLQSQILLKVKSTEAVIGCLGSSESVEELGVNPKRFGYGRMIFQDDTNPDGLRVHYLQGCFVPNNTYLKLPNLIVN